jgi:S1-C subfamily serine protease
MTTVLDEWEKVAGEVAERVVPATVTIGRSGRGSGVVVAPGKVLTNAHNLRDRTTQVAFADGRTEQASVVAVDPDADLVVLEVDTGGIEPLQWADRLPGVGGAVLAVSRGAGRDRVTLGFVAAVGSSFRGPRGRRIQGGLEHTAPMARGSSGGPLVDRHGGLVGINTHRAGEGFYLAQAAEPELVQRVTALTEGRQPTRVELGISVAPAGVARKLRRSVGLDERDGVLVRGVAESSPAAAGELREGDLIVAAGGRAVASVDDLHAVLGAHDATEPLSVSVVRGADEVELTISFG